MKNNVSILTNLFVLFLILQSTLAYNQTKFGEQSVGPQSDGSILVPSNQMLRPSGLQINFPGRPVDIALTPDEKFLIVKNSFGLEVISITDKKVVQTLPFESGGASFTGLLLSKSGRKIFVTNAQDLILTAEIGEDHAIKWTGSLKLPEPNIGGPPVPAGLAVSEDENTIYVALSRNNTLAVINQETGSIVQIEAGIAPYEVLLVSGEKAYVSNWGGRIPAESEVVYNTSGSKVLVDPETGIANHGSVSVIDLKNNTRIKDIETGLHPCGMILTPDKSKLYVACSNSDVIAVIDTESDSVTEKISVHMQNGIPFGSAPNALAISPDGKTLYAANGTDNAICVIRTKTPSRVTGYIPVGWYPGAVTLDRKGKWLFVANVKGIGSRNKQPGSGGFSTYNYMGSVSLVPVPGRKTLRRMTGVVQQNNMLSITDKAFAAAPTEVPVPRLPGQKSPIRHVIYIIKENRTYDQVFGDMEQGNGDTSLLEFGREVTPNHHLLAETFGLLDNFNCSGVLSADGHQWTDEAYVTDYLEKSFGDFTRSYPYDGDDALAYAGSGFIWDNVLRHDLTFRNYGEFVNAVITPPNARFIDIYKDVVSDTLSFSIRSKVNLEQLEPYSCPTYVSFPTKIPDIYRAGEFIKELKTFEENDDLPNFIIMSLPNDHTTGTRPGYPTPSASVADNDLALGMIVEAVSHSKFWKETCIFVTEDDPQDGLDHVDGHRTVGLAISPWSRRGKVISAYYSQINMVRTIENILGLPPMNKLDLYSEPMSECFQEIPDFTPYDAVTNNIPLDSLNPALSALRGDALYWAKKSLEQDLDDVDRIEEDVFNRIIWHAVRGYDVPYPLIHGDLGQVEEMEGDEE